MASVDDLSGKEVFVRQASIYYETLSRLNEQLKARGKASGCHLEAPAVLEDDDVLEMVNAGLVSITVVDDYLAEFWSKVFTGLTVRPDITVRSGGNLALVFRKENPKLEGLRPIIRAAPEGRRLPQCDRTPISRECQVRRRTPRPTPSARSCRRSSNCSGNTAPNTTSTFC